jgi:sugar lactone lactonase YvrE
LVKEINNEDLSKRFKTEEDEAEEAFKVNYLASLKFNLAESPVWSEDHDCFYFTDILQK